VASRTVGVLLISSLMILPVACALRVAKSYRQTVLWSSAFGVLFTLIGLTLAYYLGLKPGGAIVLTAVACFLILFAFYRSE
jgi:zinc transport system permease protein